MDILGQLLENNTPIYNRYLAGDFQVGTDNLNPKRELQQDALLDMEKLRLALYIKYKDQIKGLKGDNSIGAPVDLGLPYENRTRAATTVPIREAMAPTSTPAPLENELYDMLNIISAFLGGEPITLDDLPFDICGDRSGGSGTTPGGAAISGGLVGADSTGTSENPSSGSADSPTDIKCIMVELEMLQTIFKILNFVRQFIALEQRALAFIYPYIEFIQMVVACILNPAMVKQLVMSLVGQALAMLISFLTDLLSQLLGNLNLDCILSNSMSVVQQVMGSISSVADTGSAVGSFINFNTRAVNSAAATLSSGDALAKALGVPAESQWKSVKQTAGELFDATVMKGYSIAKNTTVGVATAVIGSAVSSVQGIAGTIENAVVNGGWDAAGKLLKNYFPGAEFVAH